MSPEMGGKLRLLLQKSSVLRNLEKRDWTCKVDIRLDFNFVPSSAGGKIIILHVHQVLIALLEI